VSPRPDASVAAGKLAATQTSLHLTRRQLQSLRAQ